MCIGLDQPFRIECGAGGDLHTAAVAHLAQSSPTRLLFSAYEPNFYHIIHFTKPVPKVQAGSLSAPEGPGLGVEVDMDVLGEPLFTVQ